MRHGTLRPLHHLICQPVQAIHNLVNEGIGEGAVRVERGVQAFEDGLDELLLGGRLVPVAGVGRAGALAPGQIVIRKEAAVIDGSAEERRIGLGMKGRRDRRYGSMRTA